MGLRPQALRVLAARAGQRKRSTSAPPPLAPSGACKAHTREHVPVAAEGEVQRLCLLLSFEHEVRASDDFCHG